MKHYRVFDKVRDEWADIDNVAAGKGPFLFNSLTGAQDYKTDLARARATECKVTLASAYDTYETVTVDSNGRRAR